MRAVVRVPGEVAVLAARRALDQVQRSLRGSDTGPQPRRLTDEHRPALVGVRGKDRNPDRIRAEPCLLGPDDDTDPGEVVRTVTPPLRTVPRGRHPNRGCGARSVRAWGRQAAASTACGSSTGEDVAALYLSRSRIFSREATINGITT
ncbi:hypothetical protein GCM10010207_72960 [Streptomyces atratus]|nr:hypothetical protein GCM10010207_72960 [Streptomyces atratus]